MSYLHFKIFYNTLTSCFIKYVESWNYTEILFLHLLYKTHRSKDFTEETRGPQPEDGHFKNYAKRAFKHELSIKWQKACRRLY